MLLSVSVRLNHSQQAPSVSWKDVKADLQNDLTQLSDMTHFALFNFVLSGAEMLDNTVDALNKTLARVEATLKMGPTGDKKELRRNATVVQVTSVLTRERLARAVAAHDQLTAAGYQYLLLYWAEESTQKAADASMLLDLLPETAFAMRDIDSFDGSAEQRAAAMHYCSASDASQPRCADFLVPTVRRRLFNGATDLHHVYWVMGVDVRWVGDLSIVMHKLTPPSEAQSLFFTFFGDCLNNINPAGSRHNDSVGNNSSIGSNNSSSTTTGGTSDSALKCLADRLNRNTSSSVAAAPAVDLVTMCGSSRISQPRSRNPLKKIANAVRAAAVALNSFRRRVLRRLCGKTRTEEARPVCPPACWPELARYSGAYLERAEHCLLARAQAHVLSAGAGVEVEINSTCGAIAASGRQPAAAGGGPQSCPHVLAHSLRLTTYDALDVGLREGVLSKDWRQGSPITSAADYEVARKAAVEEGEPLVFNKKAMLFREVERRRDREVEI